MRASWASSQPHITPAPPATCARRVHAAAKGTRRPGAAAAAPPARCPAPLAAAAAPRPPGGGAAFASQRARSRAGPQRALPIEAIESIYAATGVPLVDELMGMRTVEMAVQYSAKLAAVALAGAVLGTLVLRAIDRLAGRRIARSTGKGDFNAAAAAAAAAFRPCQVLLPYYAGTYILTVGAALGQVAANKLKSDWTSVFRSYSGTALTMLRSFTQLISDTSELLIIIAVAWALIDFKSRVLHWVATCILTDSRMENSAALTLLRPLGGVLTLLIVLAAFATALSAYGINLAPVMASVGGLGIVVGLAAQKLLTNLVSAIALFTARPFVVGDEVHLLFNGMPVVQGNVTQVEPTRTIIHSDDGGLVYIDNSMVCNYIIKNMTQGRTLEAAEGATPATVEQVAAEMLE